MNQSASAVLKVGDAHDEEAAAPPPRSTGGRRWLGVVLGVAVGAGLVLAVNMGDRPDRAAPANASGTGSTTASDAKVSADLVEHADPVLGLGMAYPRTWQRVSSSGTSMVLRISRGDAVSIRKLTLDSPIDAANLADVRAVTDGILDAPKAELTMLQTEQVKVHNLIGVYYLYYFPFEGGQGVHAHYFLFKGRDMYSVVFQAASASRFETLAPTFDAVSASFEAIER